MVWVRKDSKPARKRDRQDAGTIMDLLLSPQRARRNERAATTFLAWAVKKRFALCSDNAVLIRALSEWIMELWNDGDSKEIVSDCLQSLKFLLPAETPDLHMPWKLYRRWCSKELPVQATPAMEEEVLAIAGQAFQEKRHRLGSVLLAAFDGFLRTGEFTTFTKEDCQETRDAMVISLRETKGIKRRGGIEDYVCTDPLLMNLLKRAAAQTPAGEAVIGMPPQTFRKWLKTTTAALGLQNRKLLPYSFRRGGITAAVRRGVPVSTVIHRARWHSAKVAQVYIREGEQQLAKLKHTKITAKLLEEARRHIPRR